METQAATTSQSKPDNSLHRKTVMGLFVRMKDLYSNRWTLNITENGSETRDFKLWCDKLSKRTPDEIAKGFELLERRVEERYQKNKENWPVNYAEFNSLCKPYRYAREPETRPEHLLNSEIDEEKRAENLERFKLQMKELGF